MGSNPIGGAMLHRRGERKTAASRSGFFFHIIKVIALRGGLPLQTKETAKRIALSGLLVAIMLIVGYIESLLPLTLWGIPGVKLGLANCVLVFAVYLLDLPVAWVLMLLKVGLCGLLFGGLFPASLYGLAGGVLSMLTMSILSRTKGIHIITVSMLGAAMHNVGQVLMAMLLLHTGRLLYYMAALLVFGLVFGSCTGVCAALVIRRFPSYKRP